MDFEFNRRQCTPGTGDADCTSNGLTPIRTAGDLLIQYDLANGGTHPELFLSRWITTGAGSLCEANNATPCWGARVNLTSSGDATGSINTSAIPADESDGLGGHSARTFGEAQLDLSAIFNPDVCESFGSAYLKSRSSDSFTAALKDFVPPAAVNIANCGGLSVKKYIDVNENGVADDAAGSATDLAGWSISVSKNGGGFSCTGTTDSSGNLGGGCTGLSTLLAGTYTVTENANAGKTLGTNSAPFFNTDPGADGTDGASQVPALAATPPVSEQVTIGVGDSKSVDFGNSCFATASFSVTGVPTGTTGLFVRYAVNGGATQDVNLTGTTATRTASVGGLRRGDDITWEVRSTQVNGTILGTPFELAGYPVCAGSGTAAFQTATVTGFKYKDLDADGTRDANEVGIGGFEFTLNGQQATSAASGIITFSGVAPGTYTMDEVGPPAGWQQTQPPGNGTVSVTVPLGATSVQADPFGNTPLSRIDVQFTSKAKLPGTNTDATHATTITCESGGQSVVTSGSGNSRTADDLLLTKSPVTCVITYEDP
jgi:hypothetical protein